VERYARIYLDAVAYGSWDDPRSESRVLGIVTRETAASEQLPDPQGALAAELEVYRQWADGEVYGVIVVRESDGEENSLWSCYDDTGDFSYLRQVAEELASELS
jgi:hypothetical protein